jgi:NAD(P)-dependent dehydrogenase (short-subunit alcohol dehydrogenase family)
VDDLTGKVAFVTGSAGGIGLGIARACANAGMRVVLTDRDEVMLEESAAALRETGADVMAVALDVTDRDGWARAVDRVSAAMGPVQLLVNNAGVSTAGMRFDEVGPELWDRVIDINLTGVYNGVHFFLDGMRAAGGGHIVNTSSAAGLLAPPELGPYVATKAAIIGLAESLRLEQGNRGRGGAPPGAGRGERRYWRCQP